MPLISINLCWYLRTILSKILPKADLPAGGHQNHPSISLPALPNYGCNEAGPHCGSSVSFSTPRRDLLPYSSRLHHSTSCAHCHNFGKACEEIEERDMLVKLPPKWACFRYYQPKVQIFDAWTRNGIWRDEGYNVKSDLDSKDRPFQEDVLPGGAWIEGESGATDTLSCGKKTTKGGASLSDIGPIYAEGTKKKGKRHWKVGVCTTFHHAFSQSLVFTCRFQSL